MPDVTMTSRQRVKAAINFQKPDRMPFSEGPWPDTLELWHQQGLPRDVSLDDYFGFDISYMSLDCSPRFEQKIISHDGEWYTYQDRWGYTATKKFGKASSVHFFDHKTTDPAVWQANKHRWSLSKDPAEPARIDTAGYFEHFAAYPTWEQALEKYRKIYANNRYLLFECYGPWESTWRHLGYEEQLVNTALNPDWVREMAQTHVDLLIAVLQRCLDCGMRPDGFYMVDDLAENRGLLISPTSWREIFKPAVKKLGDFLAKNRLDFWMHCCGNAEQVFDDLIECGLRVMQPLQASTGLNVVELRKKYGRRLAFYGNISAPKMAGPLDVLEEEIKSKVVIARDGGYIFHSDHSVPPDVSFERYQWIVKTARKYADKPI
ncbi:MAG: hypothetical protein NT011_01060 [Kiritimatiellaeota bacterium]|nr:hypothetical protein [Kiritimatiellota bacterium]